MKKELKRKGYTVKEMDKLAKKYIKESAELLRAELRAAWKKNATVKTQ